MKKAIRIITLITAIALPFTANAADKSSEKSTPAQDTMPCPGFDQMMQGVHMMRLMPGKQQGKEQDGYMMMRTDDWKQMQQQMQDMHKEMQEMHQMMQQNSGAAANKQQYERRMIWEYIAMRLGGALLLGGAIGVERQWRSHYVGLRKTSNG